MEAVVTKVAKFTDISKEALFTLYNVHVLLLNI